VVVAVFIIVNFFLADEQQLIDKGDQHDESPFPDDSARIKQSNYLHPGANTTIVSYNASAVKIYKATSSQVHFENNYFSSSLKNALAL
jgi:hypothetical protein